MERPGEGTKFTLDRKIFSSDIWFASPWKLKIFIYLLGNANHKSGNWKGIPLKRGELIRSYRRIAKDCGYKIGYRWKQPSLSTVAQICEELTKELRIERRSEQGAQVITILNYDELQPMKNANRTHEPKDYRTITEQNNNDKELNTKNQQLEIGIIELCQALTKEKIFPKAFSFAGRMRKENMHPGAILYSLTQCAQYKPKEPYPYCKDICKKESGNFYEAEHHLRTQQVYGEGKR